MQNIYVKTYFPKQRSVAITLSVGLLLTLVYTLGYSPRASGATVSSSSGSCTQTVSQSTGVIVTVVNGNCVVTFTSGVTDWTVPAGNYSVTYLVVGGGGGGGSGGGGGGGVIQSTNSYVSPGQIYSVTVGAGGLGGIGGSGSASFGQGSTNGGDSKFDAIATAIGGGAGGQGNKLASAGGSGGGATFDCTIADGSAQACPGAGTGSQGYNGGVSGHNGYGGGAGGGGAGGAGVYTALYHIGGNGGAGVSSSITGSPTYYGGGGGGGLNENTNTYCGLNSPFTSDANYYCTSNSIPVLNGGGSGGVGGGGRGSSFGFFGITGWGIYSNATSGTANTGGGGGGTDPEDIKAGAGGSGIVVLFYIPAAARLIGNGGTMKTFTASSECTGGMRGLTSDGTYVYFRTPNSASNICIANLSTGAFVRAQAVSGASLSGVPIEQNALTFSGGCLFVRNSIHSPSTLNCIDTTTWIMSTAITPTNGTIPEGVGWLIGNLVSFPDGRIGAMAAPSVVAGTGGAASGANQCPTGSYCKILRTFSVTRSGGSAVLTFSEDFTLVDPNSGWPVDDHGMATDGTYLYEIEHQKGYKVWALKSGTPSPIVFDGAGSGTCKAHTGYSGGMCYIYQPITPGVDSFGNTGVENATFLSRSHLTNQYLIGAYSASKFWVSDSIAPPQGPGSATAPNAPTIGLATAVGQTTATVGFTAPVSDGGAAITSYTATSSPGSITGVLSQSGSGTITVSGLTSNTAYTFTVTATNAQGTSPPSVASNSITTTAWTASIAVPESTLVAVGATTAITGLSVGGLATGSMYLVAIGISNAPTGASLKLQTTTGLTASYGFASGANTFSSFTNIAFTGSLSNVNAALASMQYVSGAISGSPTIKVTASSSNSSYALNGYNGHFYVSNATLGLVNSSYTDARTSAQSQTYRGLHGYLTTITSSGENNFISYNISGGSSVWIGATDEGNVPTFSWDSLGGSPEAGTSFCSGLAPCNSIAGAFTSFASGEPNNYASSERYLVTNWNGSLGLWNDCDNLACRSGTATPSAAYVIEFGTNASDAGFVGPSSDLASSTFTLFYATSTQLPSVLLVDPQSSSVYLPTSLNSAGPANTLLCFNETDASGINLGSPAINFDVGGQGISTGTLNSATFSGGMTTSAQIYGATANVFTAANTLLGTKLYLSSGTFNSSTGASRYIRVRAISIVSPSSLGSKTCSSSLYASQIIEIRPLGLMRIMKKGVIALRG